MKRLAAILTIVLLHSCKKEGFNQDNTIEEPIFEKCIYLDFDGETVKSNSWNNGIEFNVHGAGLNDNEINEVLATVRDKFSIFRVTITKTMAIYESYGIGDRQAVIVTRSNEWYNGTSGGTAVLNSFGKDIPVFVFSQNANDYPPTIGKAICHEIGHSLGLYHQSKYNTDCSKGNEYREGCIMGLYYGNSSWAIGQSSLGCDSIQNDVQIISETLKLK